MQAPGVVDLIDEVGNIGRDVVEGLIGHQVDGLDLQGLHEALGLGVVVRIAAPAHRTDQPMLMEALTIGIGRVPESSGKSDCRDGCKSLRRSGADNAPTEKS